MGLTGPNGSGKSTLLKLIVGLVRATAGRVEVFGRFRTCERDFHEVRGRVGLLFQDSDDQLFCPTVAEDVAFGPLNLGQSRDAARRIVTETLDALGLADYQDRITYQLSGGEKRLVALAAVLAMQPEVLLLGRACDRPRRRGGRAGGGYPGASAAGDAHRVARLVAIRPNRHAALGPGVRAIGGDCCAMS